MFSVTGFSSLRSLLGCSIQCPSTHGQMLRAVDVEQACLWLSSDDISGQQRLRKNWIMNLLHRHALQVERPAVSWRNVRKPDSRKQWKSSLRKNRVNFARSTLLLRAMNYRRTWYVKMYKKCRPIAQKRLEVLCSIFRLCWRDILLHVALLA